MALLGAVSNLDMPGASELHGILYADDFPGADWGAKVQAAHDAAPSSGAVIDARGLTGAQSAASTIHLSKPVKVMVGEASVTLAGVPGISITGTAHIEGCGEENSIFAAGANAELITVAAGPVTINDLSMLGNSATWATATGIHITAGHGQIFERLRMIDWGGVPFTCEHDVGHFMMLTDSLVQPANGFTTAAVVINGTDDPLLSSALRHFTNIDTGGAIIDVQGSQTTQIVNCSASNVTMTTDCKKFTMANTRLTSRGDNTVIKGINHSVVGNVIAGPMEIDPSVGGSVIGPNVNVGPMVDNSGNNANVLIDHNSYSRFPVISIGTAPPSSGTGLYVSPVLTGAFQYGVQISFTATSAATTEGIGLVVRGPNTAAASFTQNTNTAIYIQNTSLGSGSSIATSYGMFIENITVGAANYAIYSQHTGQSVLSGQLALAASLLINGSGGLPASTAGSLYIASGYSSPVLGKLFCGDGTGWQLDIAKRTGGVDTTLFSFHDSGLFEAALIQLAQLGIGATPGPGTGVLIAPAALSGAFQYGLIAEPVTSSAATSQGVGIVARCDTAAASFTQGFNACFYAQNPTVGAGSAITTANGIYIENITAGATNYGLFSAHTGESVFQGLLSMATAHVTGAAGLPSSTSGTLYMASGYGSPVLGKVFVGDGTGWRLDIARRSSSADTTIMQMQDAGNFLVLGQLMVATGLSLDTGYCLRVDSLTGKESAYFTGKVRMDSQLAINTAPDSTSNRFLYVNGDAYIVGNAQVVGNVLIDDAKKLLWSDANLYRGGASLLKTDADLSAHSVLIGASTIIDSSRNATLVSLTIGATLVIDSSRNANVATLEINGTTVIDGSQNGTLASLSLTGTPLPVASGGTGAGTTAGALSNLGGATAASISATTLPLAKVTGGGADGSLTLSAQGVVTAYSAPT